MSRKPAAEGRQAGAGLGDGPPPAADMMISGLTILPGDASVVRDGAIAVRAGRIAEIGPQAALRPRHKDLPLIDGAGYLAIPGLVNAHTHASLSFFRGLGHGRDNMIESFLFPAEKSLTPELIEPLAYSYLYAGLTAGVTCFGDHYYFVSGVASALERLGLRGVVGETVADLGGAFPGLAGWIAWRAELERWPYSSRVKPAIAPHAADTVSAPLLKELAAFAKSRALPLHMHLSQTAGERARVQAREGCSPVAFADSCGALSPATLAVHLVSIDQTDTARLARSGATAGFCPASQIIYEHLAPFRMLLEAGIPLALGTDCAASNDGTDLLAEMRLAALLAQDRGVPEAARSPAAILRMATQNGATALGLGAEVGSLAAGKAADIVFLAEDLAVAPQQNPDVDLIFSHSSRQVRHVMVDGRFVLYCGKLTLANEADLAREYTAAVGEIHRRLALA